jgi:lipoprotein-anchoring transpeptidase ErfK/SrfK
LRTLQACRITLARTVRRVAAVVPLVLSAAALGAPPAPAADPVIAPGTRAGGVAVGGLTVEQAAARLRDAISPALALPVQVRVAHARFTLTPRSVRARFDPLATARDALRAGAAATAGPDGRVDVRVPAVTSVDAARVAARAGAIDAATTKPAHDATVRITLRHLYVHGSRPGLSLSAPRLAERLAATFQSPSRARVVVGHRRVVHPAVRTRDLRRGRYGTVITIDQGHFRLRLFKRLRYDRSYRVAVGQPAYPTPRGLFSITSKAVNPTWHVPDSPWAGALRNETVAGGSDANPLKARWMGIVNGVGIHGTAETGSIGTRASHGCIRMLVPDVIDLYPRVPLGTPVLIR